MAAGVLRLKSGAVEADMEAGGMFSSIFGTVFTCSSSRNYKDASRCVQESEKSGSEERELMYLMI